MRLELMSPKRASLAAQFQPHKPQTATPFEVHCSHHISKCIIKKTKNQVFVCPPSWLTGLPKFGSCLCQIVEPHPRELRDEAGYGGTNETKQTQVSKGQNSRIPVKRLWLRTLKANCVFTVQACSLAYLDLHPVNNDSSLSTNSNHLVVSMMCWLARMV